MDDNAIDAMEARKDERRLEVAIQKNGGGMAAVRIRDNGCGIADDKLGKIFNPFYTSKESGNGLGLGVAKKVIDAHRGTIQVHSTVGVGTEFILEIPMSDAIRDAAQSADSDSAGDSISEETAPQAPDNLNRQADSGAPIVAAPTTPLSTETSRETSRLRN